MANINKPHPLGEILFVDSNMCSPKHDFLGVVIDSDFWIQEVKKEGLILEERYKSDYEREDQNLLRVLGSRSFPNIKLDKRGKPDYSNLDPNNEEIQRYKTGFLRYSQKVDLRGLVDFEGKRAVNRMLFSNNPYALEALNDARIIYEYLEGKRATNNETDEHSYDERFLRFLERAIPNV